MDRWMTGSMDLWIDMSCEMSGGLLVTAHGGLGHRGTVPARDETTGFIWFHHHRGFIIMSYHVYPSLPLGLFSCRTSWT